MKPLGKVKIEWSPNFAYALGLLATDGSLSKDGRHLDFTSNDLEQLHNFMKCLGIKVKIGYKSSGFSEKLGTHIQFGDVIFYQFLLSIGFMPAKTKIISSLEIPNKYFYDFLRGHLDGDGSFYSYWDQRWHSSFMFYIVFISASRKHLDWIREKLFNDLQIKGHITQDSRKSTFHLKYAKQESAKLVSKIYYSKKVICLSRKRKKIEKALKIDYKHNKE